LELVIYTEGLPFDGAAPFERSLGGSESAVVFMARELARLGHSVQVFCHCERPGEYEGVGYRDLADFPEFVEAGECDVFICCRHLRGLTAPVRSQVNAIWSHDLMQRAPAQYLMSLMYKVDRLFVLSEFHKQQFMRHLGVPEERYVVTHNGVDLTVVDEAITGVERDCARLLYTSRPERGLEVLLGIWPELKRRRPEVKLAVAYYDNPGADRQMADYLAALRRAANELPDVELLGALSKRELYREIARSALVLYPAIFPEVSCISALEAAACGTPMVASRYCALKESVGDGETGVLIPGDPHSSQYAEAFVNAVADLLADERRYQAMSRAARRRIEERYQWRQIAREWEGVFREMLAAGVGTPALQQEEAGVGTPALQRQTLSVCMIVKEAQGTLYRCLESVKPIADELIICDTGSTDRTVEIAQEYTDQVYRIPWEDDFSAARNRSVEKATKDWILWIDADEYLVGAEHLGKYLRDNMYNGYVIRQHHHAIDAQFKPDVPVRLYRNHRGVGFYGCVHEHPETALNQGVTPAVILSDVHIVHDGYVTEEIRRRRFLRNLPLLIKDRQRHPNRRLGLVFLERDYVHLARYDLERTRGQMTEKARRYLERAIEIHREHFRSPDDPLHSYSLPLYQSALELLGEGFELEYALALPEGAGGKLPSAPLRAGLPNGRQRRRFLDEAEAREFLAEELRRLVREGEGEEGFAFEEQGPAA